MNIKSSPDEIEQAKINAAKIMRDDEAMGGPTQQLQKPELRQEVVQGVIDRLHKKLWVAIQTAVEAEQYYDEGTVDEKMTGIFSYMTGVQASILGSVLLDPNNSTSPSNVERVWESFGNNMRLDFIARLDTMIKQAESNKVQDAVVVDETPPKDKK